MALAHRCPDGQPTRLERNGPTGTTTGVTFTCPRCARSTTADTIQRDTHRVLGQARRDGRL